MERFSEPTGLQLHKVSLFSYWRVHQWYRIPDVWIPVLAWGSSFSLEEKETKLILPSLLLVKQERAVHGTAQEPLFTSIQIIYPRLQAIRGLVSLGYKHMERNWVDRQKQWQCSRAPELRGCLPLWVRSVRCLLLLAVYYRKRNSSLKFGKFLSMKVKGHLSPLGIDGIDKSPSDASVKMYPNAFLIGFSW